MSATYIAFRVSSLREKGKTGNATDTIALQTTNSKHADVFVLFAVDLSIYTYIVAKDIHESTPSP